MAERAGQRECVFKTALKEDLGWGYQADMHIASRTIFSAVPPMHGVKKVSAAKRILGLSEVKRW
jgi:hypothetical protein